MKNNLILIIIILCLIQETGICQYATFSKQSHGTNAIAVPAGEIWQVHSWYSSVTQGYGHISGRLGTNSPEIYLGGTSGYYLSIDNPGSSGPVYSAVGVILSGPVTFQNGKPEENYFLVFKKISSSGTANNISSTSVVIPTAATGDVDVKMEQSADNVTWTECLPGTYNSSTVKRFFRLRAVEK
jgi:hypothetical protein